MGEMRPRIEPVACQQACLITQSPPMQPASPTRPTIPQRQFYLAIINTCENCYSAVTANIIVKHVSKIKGQLVIWSLKQIKHFEAAQVMQGLSSCPLTAKTLGQMHETQVKLCVRQKQKQETLFISCKAVCIYVFCFIHFSHYGTRCTCMSLISIPILSHKWMQTHHYTAVCISVLLLPARLTYRPVNNKNGKEEE